MNPRLIETTRHEPDEVEPAQARLLARDLGDLERAAQFLERAAAGDHLAERRRPSSRRCRPSGDRRAGQLRASGTGSNSTAPAGPMPSRPIRASLPNWSRSTSARGRRRDRRRSPPPRSTVKAIASLGPERDIGREVGEACRSRAPSIATIRSPGRKPGRRGRRCPATTAPTDGGRGRLADRSRR